MTTAEGVVAGWLLLGGLLLVLTWLMGRSRPTAQDTSGSESGRGDGEVGR